MIVFVNRDDLPPGRRKRPVEDIKLYHARLPIDTIRQAEIIVFVDGEEFKVLKNVHGISSFTSLEALVMYMKSAPPVKVPHSPIKTRGLGPRKDHGNLRRRKL